MTAHLQWRLGQSCDHNMQPNTQVFRRLNLFLTPTVELMQSIESIELIERKLDKTTAAYAFMVTLGLLLALFSAHHLVVVASDLAVQMMIPHAVIGTTVSGIGTSLPELTIALVAARRSQGVAIGTLIGSNITDPLSSIGLAAMVNPIALTDASYSLTMYLIVPATLLGTAVALLMMRSEYEFKRYEGLILIMIYVVFLSILIAEQMGKITI